jgi:lysophospholipase L1-like esterase
MAATAVLLTTTFGGTISAAAAPPLPNSMAAVGDSITQAFDIDWCCFLADSPQYSWSTGDDPAVQSHYQRILAGNLAIRSRAYNLAVSGAKVDGLRAQLQNAAVLGVDYVTILIGANDLCTSTIASMTPADTFRSQVDQALTEFTRLSPNTRIFVSSIPDIYQLWSLFQTDWWVQFWWSLFGICQSMLSSNNTEFDRQQVVAREQADNESLRTVCARFTQCRWDGYATYNFKFPASDASSVDYFHPNFAGQNHLAAITWGASYWGTP